MALWCANLTQRLSPEDTLLLGTAKAAAQIPELLWADAAAEAQKAKGQWRRRANGGVRQLVQEGRLERLLEQLGASPALVGVRIATRAWAESRQEAGAVACAECGHGVKTGVVCRDCGKAKHFGCAWAALSAVRAEGILPPMTAGVGTVTHRCHLCRQGAPTHRKERGSLLTRFRTFVDELSVDDAIELIDVAESAGPTRRRLPGSGLKRAGMTAGRYLATAAVAALVDLVQEGDRTAEVMLMFAPRLFMRKHTPIEEQLLMLVEGRLERSCVTAPKDPHAAWAAAVEGALEDGNIKKVVAVVMRGPRVRTVKAAEEQLRAHYPAQKENTGEARNWARLRATIVSGRASFTVADMRKWARTHLTSSGGSTGWTGALMVHIQQTDAAVFSALAGLWARAPSDWLYEWTANTAFRRTDGWPIPKGDGIRPIAGPQFVRRIASAAAMRRAQPLVERYCRERGQYGLSGEAHTIAYSLIPLLTASAGGTVLTADRSMSFQTIGREAVFAAVTDCVGTRIPTEDDAAAALVDACLDLYADGGEAIRTYVGFDEVDGIINVDGLAQGCSLSPVLEAVVLAWQAAGAPTPRPGVVTMGAHDDFVACAQAGTGISELVAPDCETVGGAYNDAKAVAYGAERNALVASGRASVAATHGSVWGRPVGDVAAWFAEVWLTRWYAKCAQLRALAKIDAAVAIWAAHAMGGPGNTVTHVLRGIPLGLLADGTVTAKEIGNCLALADESWLDVLCELAGATEVTIAERERVGALVFGLQLGHVSAAALARGAAAAGMVVGFPVVCALANRRGLDMSRWADTLGLDGLRSVVQRPIVVSEVAAMVAILQDVVKAEAQKYLDGRAPTDTGCTTNLWVEALHAPTQLHAAVRAAGAAITTPGHRAITVRFALARALRLPVWDLVGGLPGPNTATSPTACGLCKTAVTLAAGDPARGPRATLDAHGEHAGACTRTSNESWNTTRHNRLVRVAVEIGLHAGIRSHAHDGPVFQLPGTAADNRKRPADWMEVGGEDNAADAARYPAGRCYDLTIRSGGAAELEAATKAKVAKYASAMAQHKHIGFTVAAVSYSGCVSAGTEATFRRWAYHIARTRRADADIVGRPLAEVTAAFGLGFATVAAAQVAAYADQVRSAATTGTRALRATRAYVHRARILGTRTRCVVSSRVRNTTDPQGTQWSAPPGAIGTSATKRTRRAQEIDVSPAATHSVAVIAPAHSVGAIPSEGQWSTATAWQSHDTQVFTADTDSLSPGAEAV